MVSKSSKWELDFVHYIAKFTKSRFAISRFESSNNLVGTKMNVGKNAAIPQSLVILAST